MKHNIIALSWSNIKYAVRVKKRLFPPVYDMKYILKGVDGELKSGETIAILGPSGSGKTTLLTAIAGRLINGELTGQVLVDGNSRDKTWRFISAFVEQHEYMLEHLTVRESILFSSFLRLPRDLPVELKMQRVDHLISILGLMPCQNTMISNVSGGERKRTAIAIELITSPKFIFLDEPTSGLDSFTALSLVECLKKLACDENKAVIMTIHQPRPLIMNCFNKIMLLSQGSVVFFGTPDDAIRHFSSQGLVYPKSMNVSDFLLDNIIIDCRSEELVKQSTEKVKRLIRAWNGTLLESPNILQPAASQSQLVITRDHMIRILNNISAWKQRMISQLSREQTKEETELWKDRASFWLQLRLLTYRNFTDYRRFKSAVYALCIQTLILALFVSIIFWQVGLSQTAIQNRMGVLFFLTAQEMFAFTMPISVAMPAEKSLIARERMNVTYKTSSAYLAKIVSVFPQAFLSTVVLGVIVYWTVGLQADIVNFLLFQLILVLTVLCSQAIGMIVGSVVDTIQLALIVGPMVDLLFIVFAGSIINTSTMPVFISWLQYISPASYAYRGLMQNEFEGLEFACNDSVAVESLPCFQTGEQVLNYYSLNMISTPICICLLIVLLLTYHLIGYILLRQRTKPNGKLL